MKKSESYQCIDQECEAAGTYHDHPAPCGCEDDCDAQDPTSVIVCPERSKCSQCRRAMNPVDRALGPVCGRCCRENQRAANGRK